MILPILYFFSIPLFFSYSSCNVTMTYFISYHYVTQITYHMYLTYHIISYNIYIYRSTLLDKTKVYHTFLLLYILSVFCIGLKCIPKWNWSRSLYLTYNTQFSIKNHPMSISGLQSSYSWNNQYILLSLLSRFPSILKLKIIFLIHVYKYWYL